MIRNSLKASHKNKYVPVIKLSKSSKELFKVLEETDIIPYINIGMTSGVGGHKSPEDYQKQKDHYISKECQDFLAKRKHFVDFDENIPYGGTAIRTYNFSTNLDKSLVRSVITQSRNFEVAITLCVNQYSAMGIKQKLFEYLDMEGQYWLLFIIDPSSEVKDTSIIQICEDLKLLGFKNVRIVFISTAFEKNYSSYELDKVHYLPNDCLRMYDSLKEQLGYETHYGDLLGYEFDTSTGVGFTTKPHPRICLVNQDDPYTIAFLRVKPHNRAKTEKSDFQELQIVIREICEENHCSGCKYLLERDLWTNTVKRYAFLHNLVAMRNHFEKLK